MAYLCIVINSSNDSIANLNDKIQRPTKALDAVVNVRNYMDALLAGAVDGTVQVTTRSTDPSIGTAGSDSEQESYDLS